MEEYFILNQFEEGYHVEEFIYEDVLFEYATEALQIPEEKINQLNFYQNNLEVTLKDLEIEDYKEDWFVNLQKINIA